MRPGIADPEGATIERALPALGFDDVDRVRAGRAFRFELEAADEAAARARAGELADRLLANPVIEEARLESRIEPPAVGPGRRLMATRVGVVVFPGTNCEHDAVAALDRLGGRRRAASGTATPNWAASTRWCCRAVSPTATTCDRGRSPASPR